MMFAQILKISLVVMEIKIATGAFQKVIQVIVIL